jgi:hypothetical protein
MRDSCASKGAHRVGSRVGMCLVLGLGYGDQAHSILVNHKQLYIYIQIYECLGKHLIGMLKKIFIDLSERKIRDNERKLHDV